MVGEVGGVNQVSELAAGGDSGQRVRPRVYPQIRQILELLVVARRVSAVTDRICAVYLTWIQLSVAVIVDTML